MWTLAHAHGTLLGLVHLAFAASLPFLRLNPSRLRLASTSLIFASVLLPGGFFLAGIRFYEGDPGPGHRAGSGRRGPAAADCRACGHRRRRS